MAKKNIVVIQLCGGLGNQMFQYAVARVLAKKYEAEVLVDLSFFKNNIRNEEITERNFDLSGFKNSYKFIEEEKLEIFKRISLSKRLRRRFNLNYAKIYKEKSFHFQPELFLVRPPVYLIGYFQSYKYFENEESFIRKIFSFSPDKLDKPNLNLQEYFHLHNTVSVHIRRGDYINNSNVQQIHGSCDISYYKRAISLLQKTTKDPIFIFFSDDISWVREQFSGLSGPTQFIDHNFGPNSWKDLFLMSGCKHNIIANSTFSWWGAWLNSNLQKIVVAPKIWFKDKFLNDSARDLLPPQWLKI